MKFSLSIFAFIILPATALSGQQLAFPTAEGYGKYTIGGRGGSVHLVTNLNDSGPGSLRSAIEATEPRTIVFRVSGTIILDSPLRIEHPYVTIAGQTAPGDGICIRRHQVSIDADQVIIRYIRVRLGDESGEDADAISARYVKNIILDHVSASWSVDETMSIYRCDSITVQWCIISESMFQSNHTKGHHGFGGIWGGNHATYHHNLLAHHSSRNPRFASGVGFTDYRNNVIYNWGYNSCYGGENVDLNYPDRFNSFTVNMVANYYKPGPATQPGPVSFRIANPSANDDASYGSWHIAQNYVHGYPDITANNWKGGVQVDSEDLVLQEIRKDSPWPSMAIAQHTPEKAFELVLQNAGASQPVRDTVDQRIAREARSGTATYEGEHYELKKNVSNPELMCGIIDSQKDVGGWPLLRSVGAPRDTDADGMPDWWEDTHNLDKNNPNDRNTIAPDGYTMLEKYLNTNL